MDKIKNDRSRNDAAVREFELGGKRKRQKKGKATLVWRGARSKEVRVPGEEKYATSFKEKKKKDLPKGGKKRHKKRRNQKPGVKRDP